MSRPHTRLKDRSPGLAVVGIAVVMFLLASCSGSTTLASAPAAITTAASTDAQTADPASTPLASVPTAAPVTLAAKPAPTATPPGPATITLELSASQAVGGHLLAGELAAIIATPRLDTPGEPDSYFVARSAEILNFEAMASVQMFEVVLALEPDELATFNNSLADSTFSLARASQDDSDYVAALELPADRALGRAFGGRAEPGDFVTITVTQPRVGGHRTPVSEVAEIVTVASIGPETEPDGLYSVTVEVSDDEVLTLTDASTYHDVELAVRWPALRVSVPESHEVLRIELPKPQSAYGNIGPGQRVAIIATTPAESDGQGTSVLVADQVEVLDGAWASEDWPGSGIPLRLALALEPEQAAALAEAAGTISLAVVHSSPPSYRTMVEYSTGRSLGKRFDAGDIVSVMSPGGDTIADAVEVAGVIPFSELAFITVSLQELLDITTARFSGGIELAAP